MPRSSLPGFCRVKPTVSRWGEHFDSTPRAVVLTGLE